MNNMRYFSRMAATKGNQLVFPAGQDVFTSKGVPRVKVGQPVFWNSANAMSISPADIENRVVTDFNFSICYLNSQGKKKLVNLDGSDWQMCKDKFRISHTLPQCACPQKVDVFFDCVKPNVGYSIAVTYRDAQTKAIYGGDGEFEYQFGAAPTPVALCEDCPNPSLDPWAVACGISKHIRSYGEMREMEYVGRVNQGKQVYMPLKSVPVAFGKKIHTLKLSPASTPCNNCNVLEGLKTLRLITIDPASTINIDLSDFEVDDATNTDVFILEVAQYLEEELAKHNAYVNISHGTSGCCEYEVEITGCFDTAIWITSDNTETTFTTYDPWDQEAEGVPSFPADMVCTPCAAAGEPTYPTAMFRLYTESIEAKCGCLNLPGDNLNWAADPHKRIIDVHALTGFNPDRFLVRNYQEQRYQVNLGYYFLHMLDEQSLGGLGADLWQGGGFYGKYPQQMNNHKLYDSMFNIECKTDYCSVDIVAQKGNNVTPLQNQNLSTRESQSSLLVPKTDTDTYLSIKEYLDAIVTIGNCNRLEGGCYTVPSINITGTETVAVAATTQLTLVVTPTEVVPGVWSSSNPAVATVSVTGLVTGVSAGSATITFTPTSGFITADTLAVTVTL